MWYQFVFLERKKPAVFCNVSFVHARHKYIIILRTLIIILKHLFHSDTKTTAAAPYLPLCLTGESVGFEGVSGQTAAESSATAPAEAAAEPLALRLGGEDFHRVACAGVGLRSRSAGHGSEVNLDLESERSALCSATCGSQVGRSIGMVRGSGFMIPQMRCVVPSPSLSSTASVLEITLKCVFSEGVMVSIFASGLSFLVTWMQERKMVFTR